MLTGIMPGTISKSFDKYMEDYNMPQASIVTSPHKYISDLENIDNVTDVEANFIINTTLEFNGIKRNTRVFSRDNGFKKYNIIESSKVSDDENRLWLSSYFANYNNIKAGDKIKLKVNDDYIDFTIESLVSTPDGMRCCYDDTNWAESGDFSYIYIDRDILDEKFNCGDYYNSWNFLFDNEADADAKKTALQKAEDILNTQILSKQIYEDSKAKQIIDGNIKSLTSTCTTLPVIVFLIVICCSFLFVKQIIRNQRKKIGLLLSLGYTHTNIIWSFICFILLIMLCSVTLGVISGVCIDLGVSNVYKRNFSLPDIYFVVDWKIFIMLLMLFLSGICSCLFSIRDILNIEPGNVELSFASSSNALEISMSKKKINTFVKITVSNIFSQKRRLFLSVFSIAACMVLTYIGFACLQAKFTGDSIITEKRMFYDYLVQINNPNNAIEDLNIEGTDQIEPMVIFTDIINNEGDPINIQIQAIKNDSNLIKVIDKEGNNICVGDGIILEEYVAQQLGVVKGDKITVCDKELTVDEISRDIIYPIQYISFDTANYLGYEDYNAVSISEIDHDKSEDFYNKLIDNKHFKYGKILSNQVKSLKTDMKAINILFYVLVILSIVIAVIILYNMTIIKINEKIREYSTLLCIGTKFKYFLLMAFCENIIQYIFAAIVSVIPSYFLAKLVLNSMSSSLEYFAFMNESFLYALVFAVSFVYVIFGILFTLITIYRINPVDYINEKE